MEWKCRYEMDVWDDYFTGISFKLKLIQTIIDIEN